jgi:hypothetical protein
MSWVLTSYRLSHVTMTCALTHSHRLLTCSVHRLKDASAGCTYRNTCLQWHCNHHHMRAPMLMFSLSQLLSSMIIA